MPFLRRPFQAVTVILLRSFRLYRHPVSRNKNVVKSTLSYIVLTGIMLQSSRSRYCLVQRISNERKAAGGPDLLMVAASCQC